MRFSWPAAGENFLRIELFIVVPPPCYWVPENKGGHNTNGEYQIRVPPYLAGRRPENFGGF